MTQLRRLKFNKLYVTLLALLILAVPVFTWVPQVEAGFLNQRSVLVGDSTPSAITNHTFTFTLESSAIIGSILLQYCANSPLFGAPCSPPAGLNLASVVLANQTGQTGFVSTAPPSPNDIIISRVPTFANSGIVSYQFNNIVNPSGVNSSIYVRIQTYASADASGSPIDTGTVVFSTSGSFNTKAYVPPYLTFCVGVLVASDCSTTTGDFIDFGELSTTSTKVATLQFAAATNVDTGYVVAFLGTSLTSGNNVIPAPSAASPSVINSNQFGFNLRANSNPAVGSDPTGFGTAVPTANYNTPNRFALLDGDVIAIASMNTNFTVFTGSYIVNINKTQVAGVYSTTNTYVATGQF